MAPTPIELTQAPIPTSKLTSPANTAALRGTSILITGGASGIGAALAHACASAGAVVTIADINQNLGSDLAKKLSSLGQKVGFVHTDVRDWQSNVDAFQSAVRYGGDRLDHVVLNAGVLDEPFFSGASKSARHVDDEGDDGKLLAEPDSRVIDVCAKGVMYGMKLAQVYLNMEGAENAKAGLGGKSILVTLSPESYFTLPGCVNYAGGKYGTRGLWRASREAFAAMGIRSNGLVPWLVDTPMNSHAHVRETLLSLDIHFTPVEAHVAVAMHLLSDSNTAGRAVALGEPGQTIVDIEDDETGFDGSKRIWELLHNDLPGVHEKFARMYGMLGFNVNIESTYF